MSRNSTAIRAIKLINEGIAEKSKEKILQAYKITDMYNFEWEKIDEELFNEFNELVDCANEIILD